jgi:manganese/zinc/iron transport system permease protein
MSAILFLDDYTLRIVALGAATLGIVSGALGTFAVLRRQALVGDAISHAALPGVALAYLVTGSKASLALMIGAALAGFVAVALVGAVVRTTRVKQDAALGIWLSVFFGLGLVLLTYLQSRPDASQAGLDRFLFGQAATLLREDVATMAAGGGLALLVMLGLWKELKVLAFDREYGVSLGLRMRLVDVVLTSLLVVAIVIGLQTVGAVLMAALIVAPASAARQWTDRLGVMTVLAAAFGATAGVVGAVASAEVARLPTGPAIVIVATLLVVMSLLLAPRRGLVFEALRARAARGRLHLSAVLEDLARLERDHEGPVRGHHAATISAMVEADARVALEELSRRGLVERTSDDLWLLTEGGKARAARR